MNDLIISPLAATLRVQNAPIVQAELVAARTAATTAGAAQAQVAAPEAPDATDPVSPLRQVLEQTAQTAATRQDGAAPLLASLYEAIRGQALAPNLRSAAERLLLLLNPLDERVTAADISLGFLRSGVLFEAALGADSDAPPPDWKAALLGLKAAFERATSETPGHRGGAPIAPPPVKDGPLSGQAAQAVGANGIEHIADQAGAALARVELLQLASLPAAEAKGQAGELNWMFEIPFSTPQGASVGQFEIRRDAPRRDAAPEAPAPTWRVRFAIDIEPAGAVQGEVSLAADRSRVTLWAEREATQAALDRDKPLLAAVLGGAEVQVRAGAPTPPALPPGGLVDRQT